MILEIKGDKPTTLQFYMKRDWDGDIEVGFEVEGVVLPLVFFSAANGSVEVNRYHLDSFLTKADVDVKKFVKFDANGYVKTNE